MGSLRIAIQLSLLDLQRTNIIPEDTSTPPINDCIFCSPTSVEQENKKSNYHAPSVQQDDMVHCTSCNRKACGTCIRDLHQLISSYNNKLPSDDTSVIALNNMYHALSCPNKTVSVGTCCAFSKSITNNNGTRVKRSTIKPPKPPNVDNIEDGSDSAHDDSMNSTKPKPPPPAGRARVTAVNDLRKRLNRKKPKDSSKLDNLLNYHDSSAGYNHKDKLMIRRPRHIISKMRARKKRDITQNIHEGGLVLQSFGLLIQGDVSPHHLYVDHMALAKSKDVDDNTPAILHSVVNKVSSDRSYKYGKENNKERAPFQYSDRKLVTVTVPSPEDATKSREVVVDVMWVDQKHSIEDTNNLFEKGTNTYDPDYLYSLNTFGNDDIKDGVDYTMILGKFTLESGELPDKLLLMRPTSMMTNVLLTVDEINDTSEKVYDILRSHAGYETNRFGGSSENVSSTTDQDFLAVMSERRGLSPRHMYANIIIRCKRWYWIVYRRVQVEAGESLYAMHRYSPPKDGGGFDMPALCSSVFLILGDISYNKMMVILTVAEVNKKLESLGIKPVAAGPIRCEMKKILKVRGSYESTEENKMHTLVHGFNQQNKFSMVAYAVGAHNDHYINKEEEYIENKALFATKMRKGSIGRGGSIVGDKYVYAILDWGKEAKERAKKNKAAKARKATLRSSSGSNKRRK